MASETEVQTKGDDDERNIGGDENKMPKNY
jgi:hypothetical protein